MGAVDQLLLLEIYSAGEKAIEGINSSNIKKSLHNSGFNNVELLLNNEVVIGQLGQNIDSDTVFIFQGAGNISSISNAIKKEIS